MAASTLRNLWALACGILFSAGVVVSGMVRPSKVLGFLDFTQRWDPSLMFVMVGAIGVYAVAWAILGRRQAPLLGGTLPDPAPRNIDARLVGGAAIFGVGWGLAGYCPGPAIAATATGLADPLLFFGAMLVGMRLFQAFERVPADEASPSGLPATSP